MVQVSPKYTPRSRAPRRVPTTHVNSDLKRLAEQAKMAKEAAQRRKTADYILNTQQDIAGKDAAMKNVAATTQTDINQKSRFNLINFLVGGGIKAVGKVGGVVFGGGNLPIPGVRGLDVPGIAKPAWKHVIKPVAGFTRDAIADFYTDFDSEQEIADLDKAAAARDKLEKEIARGEVDERVRPSTPEEQEQYDAWARYRENFRQSGAGAEPESPVREGYLLPSGERVQPGVTGAIMAPLEAIQEEAAQTVAMALTTPGISEVAKIFGTENFILGVEAMEDTASTLRSMGVRPDEAAWLAYHSNDLPKFVKGALEFGLDPLNLLPGIGWGGSIARGIKITAALRVGTKGNALKMAAAQNSDIMARRGAQEVAGTSELEKVAKAINASPIDEADAASKGVPKSQLNEAQQKAVDSDASMYESIDKSRWMPGDEKLVEKARGDMAANPDGVIANFIDSLPDEGILSTVKGTRELEQLLKTPEGHQIAVSQRAVDGLNGELDLNFKKLKVAMDDLDHVFKSLRGESKPMSGGRVNVVRNSIAQDVEGFIGYGKMLDIIERASAYNLSDAQRAAIKAFKNVEDEFIDELNYYIKKHKINKFDVEEGSAWVPHRDLARGIADEDEAYAALVDQRRAFGKQRKYATYKDRWVAAKQAQDEGLPARGDVGTADEITFAPIPGAEDVAVHLNDAVIVGGRKVVMVRLADGTYQPFYKRTGGGGKSAVGAQAGDWAPFDGFAMKNNPYGVGWMNKMAYLKPRVGGIQNNPLHRWGTEANRRIGMALKNMEDSLPSARKLSNQEANKWLGVSDDFVEQGPGIGKGPTVPPSARAAITRGDDDAIRALKGMVKPEGVNQRMYDQLVESAPTLSAAQLDEQIKGSTQTLRLLRKSKTPSEVSPEFNAIAIHELAIRIIKAEKARRVAAPTGAIPMPGAKAAPLSQAAILHQRVMNSPVRKQGIGASSDAHVKAYFKNLRSFVKEVGGDNTAILRTVDNGEDAWLRGDFREAVLQAEYASSQGHILGGANFPDEDYFVSGTLGLAKKLEQTIPTAATFVTKAPGQWRQAMFEAGYSYQGKGAIEKAAIPTPTARAAAVFEPSVKPPKRGMKTPTTLDEAQTQLDEVDGYKTQLQDRLDDMENPDTKAGEALQDRIDAAETYYDELESFIDEGAEAIPTPTAAIAKEPWQMTKAEFNAARVTKQQMLDRGAEGNLNSAVEIQMPISRIEGLEPIPVMEGGYVPGRLITEPVEIRYEKDLDQFILYAGNHRVQQARINGQSTVPAFVEGIKYEDLKQAIPTPTAAKTVKKIPAKKQVKSSDAPSRVKEELPERFVKPNNPVVTETPPPKAAQGPPEPMDDGNFNRNNFGGDGPPPKTTAEPPTGPDDIVLDLTDPKELEELIFTDDYFRKIIQLPGMRQTLGHSNPTGAARTPMEKFAALRTWLMNESTERTIRTMGHIDRGAEDKLFGPFTKERLIKKGPLKGLGLNDIRTYPKRYAEKLTPEQTEWIKQMDEIERSKLASLERNEVEVNLLGFEEGGQYAGRRWMGKFDNDGKLIDIGYVGGGSRRKLPTFLEPRVLKSQSEGFKLGFQAMSETEALALNVQGHYTHIINKKMYDWLIYHSGIGYRDVGISEGMKLADAAVKMKVAAGKKAILALQRAMRGETIPTGTVKSIERVFPQLKGKVRAPTKVLAQDVIKAAKELQKPNVVLEVPKIGAIKKVQKLLAEASERLSQNPADKALRREVSRLQKSLGFIRYRVGLGKPLELIRVPAKELRKMAVDSLQEMLDAIRGTPTKVEGYKTLQYRGGLLSDLLVEQKKTSKSIADYKKKLREPGREEAYLIIPGGERRILTGPDAKTIAIRMNNIFTPAENKFYNALAFANKFNVLSRGLQLTADGGVGLIHLAILAGAEPKIWTKAMWAFHNELLRSAANKSVTNRIYKQHAALLNRWPIVQLSEQGTEATAAFARGQLLKARLPAGIPLIGGRQVLALPDKLLQPFRNAFNFAMDQAAIDLIKALEHLATTPRLKAEISRYINNVRGLGSSSQIGVGKWMRLAEQSVLLAPNYNRSIVAILSSLFRGGMDAKLARQALMRATGAFMFVTVAIGLARGDTLRESLDRFKLMKKDPKTGELKYNSEFMLFDQWGQRIGAGSKIRSVLALLATVTTSPEDLLESGMRNPAFRFMRANLAPLPSKATDLISGRNYIGDPTRDGMVSLSREVIAPTFLPLWVSSMALEGGDLKGRFSRGIADYFALRAYPQNAHHKFVAYAEEQTGKSYDGPSEVSWLSAPPYYWSWGKMEWIKEEKEKITPLELKKLKTIDPEGSRLWEAAELDWARRDKISPVMREFDRVADIRMDKLQDAADEARRTGNTPGLREAIVKINSAYGAQLQAVQSNPEFAKALDELSKIHKNEIPEQEAKRLYNEIVNDPALLNELQEYDFDERNRRLDLLEKEVGEEIWNGILAEKQLDRQRFDPLVQLWYEDKEKLKSYWELPEGERRRNERRRNKGAIDVIMIRWYGLKPGLSKAGFDEYRRIQSGKAPETSGVATTFLDRVTQKQGQSMPAPTPEPTPTFLDRVTQKQQEREPVGARE